MMKRLHIFVFLTGCFLVAGTTYSQTKLPEGTHAFRNLAYVSGGHERQTLDLYIPKTKASSQPLPLVIWVHGGGWKKGSKDRINRQTVLLENGFALASINYRLTEHATFPAQIHDCKAAIRFLRKHARSFGIDRDRFGVWGASAGGHLVALLGTSGGVKELEGDLGRYTGFSSRVQAVCDWFGPTDLIKQSEHAKGRGGDPAQLPEMLLLGGLLEEKIEVAKAASPVSYVSEDDASFLIMHGSLDPLVPVSESETLHQLLLEAEVDSKLVVEEEAGHGFRDPSSLETVVAFFNEKLKDPPSPSPDPLKPNPYFGNWALTMPDGNAAWLTLYGTKGQLDGELWMVGAPKQLANLSLSEEGLHFSHNRAVGKREYVGGPRTGKKVPLKHVATVDGETMSIVVARPNEESGAIEAITFTGKRMPPLPPQPDLGEIKFGEPIELFNGENLDGWRLTNPEQKNGWKAVDGVLVNETPKTTFDPFAHYGNLRTDREFSDFNLSIDFKVPPGGNSGIYLRGRYEAQVLDRDSKMQGIHGVGAIFNRILPSGMYGKPGDEWQNYDITLIGRHVTVILNGEKVIDNAPLLGCTNGAISADETLPGPIYLQGDHTSVSYRNIVLRPVVR